MHQPTKKRTTTITPTLLQHRTRAAMAVVFCVLVDALTYMCTAPNYALMVFPHSHRDSFVTTAPLGPAAANYMIVSGTSLGCLPFELGRWGMFADNLGHKPVIMGCLGGSVVFSILKYVARGSYWPFISLCFANGLFGGTAAIACGYVSDLLSDDRKRADMFIAFGMGWSLTCGTVLGGDLRGYVP